MHLGYFVEKLADVISAVGRWLGEVGRKLTHDPLWGGAALGVIVLILIVIFLRRRTSG